MNEPLFASEMAKIKHLVPTQTNTTKASISSPNSKNNSLNSSPLLLSSTSVTSGITFTKIIKTPSNTVRNTTPAKSHLDTSSKENSPTNYQLNSLQLNSSAVKRKHSQDSHNSNRSKKKLAFDESDMPSTQADMSTTLINIMKVIYLSMKYINLKKLNIYF